MAHLERQRHRNEETKTVASLRRTSDTGSEKNAGEDEEIALLIKLQEQVRRRM